MRSSMFHRHEIAVCGYSNSGKTTLIERLIQVLSLELRVGYVKHDAHRFEMDREGKDTWRAARSGASLVYINDSAHWAALSRVPCDPETQRSLFSPMDCVIVEGYKDSVLPKIIMIDGEGRIRADIADGRFRNVVAYVGPQAECSGLPLGVPYFQRDDIEALAEVVKERVLDG